MLGPAGRIISIALFLALAIGRGEPAGAAPLDAGSTLCLLPVQIPTAGQGSEERRADLQKRVRDALVAASFAVPDPQAVADLVERIKTETGGFIDPITGDRDAQRYGTFREQRAAALRRELACDAVVYARVTTLRVPFANGWASWDGTTDVVSSAGRVALNALGGVSETGWVGALSLWVLATDVNDQDLAFRSAGIETLASLSALSGPDALPEDVWLTNTAKIDRAIYLALGPNGESLRLRGTPSGVDIHGSASPEPPQPNGPDSSMRRMNPAGPR